jgi:hypothetical protein
LGIYKADLHVHTALSPCGELEQSPRAIVKAARSRGIRIIGIADHNASENVRPCIELGDRNGITIIPGMEVTSAEEVHILCLFNDLSDLGMMQGKVYQRLSTGSNEPAKFGYQVIVDTKDNVLGFNDRLLLGATDMPVDEVVEYARKYNGIAIAAHVDRQMFSMTSQLGFVPPPPAFDAIEVSWRGSPDEYEAMDYAVIRTSDAHRPQDIGMGYTEFELDEPSFGEIKTALAAKDGRRVVGVKTIRK